MKNIRYIIVSLLVVLVSSGAMAQTSTASYFLDGTFYNYKLNPAMKAERNFFSLLSGNLSFRTKGNVGMSDFLYPYEGNKLTTFMSGTVDKKEFLNKLPSDIRMGFGLDETLLAVGFRMLGGYSTIDISLRSSMTMQLPKGLFEFAKNGLTKERYNLSGIGMNTMNYAAISIGHSRDIIKNLRVGANLKYLVGLAYADVSVDRMDIELNDNHWMVNSSARAEGALFSEAYATLDEDKYIDGVELADKVAPSASGFAIDLGAVYDMSDYVPGLTLSASIVDLGFIKWKYMMKAHSAGNMVEFNGFNELDYDNFDTVVEDEIDRLGDEAAELVDFVYEGNSSAKTNLNATMYMGAEYSMPFYKQLTVGALYSKRFSSAGINEWYEARGFINVSPVKWFEASVNVGTTTYGTGFGWMLNFHPAGVNLFFGSDFMITDVNPQFVPINDLNAHFTFGLSVALGKRK